MFGRRSRDVADERQRTGLEDTNRKPRDAHQHREEQERIADREQRGRDSEQGEAQHDRRLSADAIRKLPEAEPR